MNVEQISLPKEQAEALYQEYRAALKGKRDAFLHELKVAYGHMRHGRAVVDVYQAMKDVGLDHNFDPRLAIVRADYPTCHLHKTVSNRAVFSGHASIRNGLGPDGSYKNEDIVIPPLTFASSWPRVTGTDGRVQDWNVRRSHVTTMTPTIPPRFMPNGNLSGYYVLWEPAGWKDATPPPPPKDPLLLKRISPNVFVALAGWDLTEVERAVLRGRIA